MTKIQHQNQRQEQSYTVTLLQPQDFSAYSLFIQSRPEALYEHSLEVMAIIKNHFKFDPKYIIAKE